MGLSAEELPPEVHCAGDCIEYLSPVYVAGDQRGRDMAFIIRCGGPTQPYPVTLDNGELLPATCLVKKLRTDSAAPTSFWRKLRTFTLVPGRVSRMKKAKLLNASLRFIIDDAMAHGRASPPSGFCVDEGDSPRPEIRAGRPAPKPASPNQSAQLPPLSRLFDSPPTTSPWPRSRSWKLSAKTKTASTDFDADAPRAADNIPAPERHQQQRRAPRFSLDGLPSSTLNFPSKSADIIGELVCASPSDDGSQSQDHSDSDSDPQSEISEWEGFGYDDNDFDHHDDHDDRNDYDDDADDAEPRTTAHGLATAFALLSQSDDDVQSHSFLELPADYSYTPPASSLWPWEVVQISRNVNPERLWFPDLVSGRCMCKAACQDNCWNAASFIYCSIGNCAVGPGCQNRIRTSPSLELTLTHTGLGVKATASIECGEIIGEYVGQLTTCTARADASQYAFQINARSESKQAVYIDAAEYGGICRFLNHSCRPNCRFLPLQHPRRVRIAIVVVRRVDVHDELKVGYIEDGESDLWFTCQCGEKECVDAK